MLNLIYLIEGIFFLFAITVHEYAHGYVAYKLGDYTAKAEGRLTLNPLKHIDLMGLLAILTLGIGWSKPVPINPYNFENQRLGELLVSFAGPASNFIMFLISVVLAYIVPNNFIIIQFILFYNATVNLILAIFNLIPLPPADGYHILLALLPPRLSFRLKEIIPENPIIMAIILLIPGNPILSIVDFLVDYILQSVWPIKIL